MKHALMLSSGPAVERLKQNVEEVRARRATLSQAICDVPFRAIHGTIPEVLSQLSVKATEAANHVRINSNVGQHTKDSPPWQ